MVKRAWTPDEARSHHVAGRLLAVVDSAPGLSFSRLKECLGVSWSSLYYYVDGLEQSGLLRVQRRGRGRLVFPARPVPDADRSRLAFPTVISRRVGEFVAKRHWRDVEELAEALEMTPRSAYYHLNHLRLRGMILSETPNGYRNFTATGVLHRALQASS